VRARFQDMTPEQLAAAAGTSSSRRTQELHDFVVSLGDAAMPFLQAMKRHPRASVRDWAIYLATKTLPGEVLQPFIREFVSDSSADVRETAIQTLIDLDRSVAPDFVPQLRRWLRSDVRRAWAIWQLVKANDTGAMGTLARLGRKPELPPYAQREARLAVLILEGRADEVLRMIREHSDHDGRIQLSGAALTLATEDARDAIRYAAEHSPDAECRATFGHALELAKKNT
jgi:hypothetical protein